MIVHRRFLSLAFAMVVLAAGCAPVGTELSAPELAPPQALAETPAPTPAPPPRPPYPGPPSRPFFMGFTRWPADLTAEGVDAAQEYAHTHSDIVSVMFIGGIPWPEMHEGKPLSKDIQQNFSYRPPAGKKLFLSISPLDRDRRALAPYWGEMDNQLLPRPWDRETLNSPRVKRAFLNFVLRSVQALRPDYLAIGVESNMLLSRDLAKWRQFKELHRDTYTAVKKRHPALPVFFTTEVLHYRRMAKDARGSDQEKEVADLMRYSDLFAMSVYPHMSTEAPRPVPANFFDFATRFKKPIAVSESGMTSQNLNLQTYGLTLYGSDTEQQIFTELLLKSAARDGYDFVINFAAIDFERLLTRLRPPLGESARVWAFTGMQTSDRKPKPASDVWNAYFRAKLVRVW